MKRFLTLIILLSGLMAIAQQNENLNIEGKCSHVKQFNKDILAGIYDWQSKYLNDYDVTFYWLDIEISNTSTAISGNTSIYAESVVVLDTFAFELIPEQTIDQIYVDGVEYTTWSRDGDNVLVPVSPIASGTSFMAQIYYHGQPPSGGFFSGVTTDYAGAWGKNVSWTLSEPFAAKDWFPVKQDLEDKADSVWVFLTTDAANMATSQGVLTNTVTIGDKKRYEWKSSYPIDYYLISFAVSEYQQYDLYAHPDEMEGDSILIENYVYDSPGCLENYKNSIDETPAMVELFSDLYILYPFWEEKYGQTLVELGGGMEHQTNTTLGGFWFGLVAHELGHMWFGDNVTCATWSDIWINEGFATYSNYLAEEFIHSSESAEGFIVGKQNSAMSQPGGSVFIPEDEIYPGNEWRIFDGRLSYNKGAAIIHTLRHEIQDDDLFFQVMETFQTDFTDSTATGEDFKNTAEAVTGMDLDYFFDQWYYGEGYPVYDLSYYMIGGNFHLVSTQTTSASSTPFFQMLMDYQLKFSDGTDTIVRFEQTDNLNHFSVYTGKEVVDVNVDPDNWTMEDVESLTVVIDELSSPVYFSIGPNPAVNTLNVFFPSAQSAMREIRLLDLTGKELLFTRSAAKQLRLDVSELPKGVYLVRVANGKQSRVRRFVK
ncbi:MAG: T9SS type A sorting domain-containing protein [Bacteroidales bacterium]|nr:T9SS type A sorting domain-containing protein [Bacteroidales bacterium]